MSLNSTSKFISLILRHRPEAIGISLDEHGWANVDDYWRWFRDKGSDKC